MSFWAKRRIYWAPIIYVILSEAKDLLKNVLKQKQMFRFAQHDIAFCFALLNMSIGRTQTDSHLCHSEHPLFMSFWAKRRIYWAPIIYVILSEAKNLLSSHYLCHSERSEESTEKSTNAQVDVSLRSTWQYFLFHFAQHVNRKNTKQKPTKLPFPS